MLVCVCLAMQGQGMHTGLDFHVLERRAQDGFMSMRAWQPAWTKQEYPEGPYRVQGLGFREELGPKIPCYRRNSGSQFPNGCMWTLWDTYN